MEGPGGCHQWDGNSKGWWPFSILATNCMVTFQQVVKTKNHTTTCRSDILTPVQAGESLGGGSGLGSLAGQPQTDTDGAGTGGTGPAQGAGGLELRPLHPLGPLQPLQPLQPLGTTQQVLGAALQTIRGSSGSLGTLVQDWDMHDITG